MMTIGQLATAAGISTRAVRHYHRLGVLPERARRGNGYREYDIKDLLLLLRVRRLTGLGLSLADCAVALSSSSEQDLRELLTELEQELLQQESNIRDRRLAVRQILDREQNLSMAAEVSELMEQLRVSARQVGTSASDAASTDELDEATLKSEAELLEMLQATLPSDQFAEMAQQYRTMVDDPTALTDGMELSRQFIELADIDTTRESNSTEYSAAEMAQIRLLATEISGIASSYFAQSGQVEQSGPVTAAGDAAWAGFGATLTPAQMLCVQLAEEQMRS